MSNGPSGNEILRECFPYCLLDILAENIIPLPMPASRIISITSHEQVKKSRIMCHWIASSLMICVPDFLADNRRTANGQDKLHLI